MRNSITPPKVGYLSHSIFLDHDTGPGHPESPKRLDAIYKHLLEVELLSSLQLITPKVAPLEAIEAVHTSEYIERVKQACLQETPFIDTPDVPVSSCSFYAALVAANAGRTAADSIAAGRVERAFCCVRPPGHHAMPGTAMGFCIFNNIAITARYIQQRYKLEKILIVDFDVHHGNGTEAIFYNDPSVLVFNVYQHPFYPQTGRPERSGEREGEGYNINVPLPSGSGLEAYGEVLNELLVPSAHTFRPDFVLVSAGFDAHENDTLGQMKLRSEDYSEITHIITGIAETFCDGRIISFLEGGYNLPALAGSVEAHLKALAS